MPKPIVTILSPQEVIQALADYVVKKRRLQFDGDASAQLLVTVNGEDQPTAYRLELRLKEKGAQ